MKQQEIFQRRGVPRSPGKSSEGRTPLTRRLESLAALRRDLARVHIRDCTLQVRLAIRRKESGHFRLCVPRKEGDEVYQM